MSSHLLRFFATLAVQNESDTTSLTATERQVNERPLTALRELDLESPSRRPTARHIAECVYICYTLRNNKGE
jgi:hypothetical protein